MRDYHFIFNNDKEMWVMEVVEEVVPIGEERSPMFILKRSNSDIVMVNALEVKTVIISERKET